MSAVATTAYTEETRRALVEAEAKELGLIPDDAATFTSVEDAMAYLDDAAASDIRD
jgi:DNA-damage-inducible protein J